MSVVRTITVYRRASDEDVAQAWADAEAREIRGTGPNGQ